MFPKESKRKKWREEGKQEINSKTKEEGSFKDQMFQVQKQLVTFPINVLKRKEKKGNIMFKRFYLRRKEDRFDEDCKEYF